MTKPLLLASQIDHPAIQTGVQRNIKARALAIIAFEHACDSVSFGIGIDCLYLHFNLHPTQNMTRHRKGWQNNEILNVMMYTDANVT